jgi:hypothetical protein
MATKRLESANIYNGYYHDRPRRVTYGKGKISDIPPCPHWIELWLLIMQQKKDEEKQRKFDLAMKREYNKRSKEKKGLSKANKTGIKGVSWNKQKRKYTAFIRIKVGDNYKNKYIGAFDSVKEAGEARDKAIGEYK